MYIQILGSLFSLAPFPSPFHLFGDDNRCFLIQTPLHVSASIYIYAYCVSLSRVPVFAFEELMSWRLKIAARVWVLAFFVFAVLTWKLVL